jgi:2-alkyl-3-oxoalkanoate reductase
MAKTVLVTGVSGFLGGALGRRLGEMGWRVTGVSRRAARVGAFEREVRGDLSLMDMGALGRFDVVVHCAALAAPWGPRAEFERHNVVATRRVMELAERCGAHLVFVSSSSVYYQWGDQLGITEQTPWSEPALNEYARTKRVAEEMVMRAQMPVTIVRPRAIFGPEDTVLFPRILRAARTGSLPRIVRADGRLAVGDLIYIDNLVEMMVRVIEGRVTGSYNLTNDEPVEMYPFLEGIFRELGYPPLRREVSEGVAFALARGLELASMVTGNRWEPPITRFGVEVMVHSKTFDVSAAKRVLGMVPVSLAEGRRRFIEWVRR